MATRVCASGRATEGVRFMSRDNEFYWRHLDDGSPCDHGENPFHPWRPELPLPRPEKPHTLAGNVNVSHGIREMESTQQGPQEFSWRWQKDRLDTDHPLTIEKVEINDLPPLDMLTIAVTKEGQTTDIVFTDRNRECLLDALADLLANARPAYVGDNVVLIRKRT